MSGQDWKPIDTAPEGVVVETKIDDGRYGVRNVQPLKRAGGRWFLPGNDRVFYVPTHWRQAERRAEQ